ncbi:hypothetical protein [Rhodanobacter geophilus]|uniref:Uncharacterized protein n=1 Tax=Rhodanobacter geophilus TaxID=3162488 RepID=A0ABV3QQJ5_9GAMM
MNVAAILQAHGFVPSVPSPRQEVGTPQALVASHVPHVPTVPTEKSRGTTKTVEAAPTDPAVRVDTRAALLALADRLGVDRAAVARIPSADLPLWAAVPGDHLPDYLRALGDAATRQAGKVPVDDTAPIYCAHCGPVFVHPSIAAVLPMVAGWPRALGCPWCAIRKAGGYVPRPCITCETCTTFQPDTVNPAAGVGTCVCGHGTHYPMQRHGCGDFQTTTTKGTDHD